MYICTHTHCTRNPSHVSASVPYRVRGVQEKKRGKSKRKGKEKGGKVPSHVSTAIPCRVRGICIGIYIYLNVHHEYMEYVEKFFWNKS